MPEVATPNQAEREFETASDEFFKNQSQVNAGYGNVLFANIKRTYDEYQQESLESIKRNRSIVDKLVSELGGLPANAAAAAAGPEAR